MVARAGDAEAQAGRGEPDPLLEHRAFWAGAAHPDDGAGRALRLVARALLDLAQRERRDHERHLAAIGRSVLLPSEDVRHRVRASSLLDVLDLLREVYDDLPDDEA